MKEKELNTVMTFLLKDKKDEIDTLKRHLSEYDRELSNAHGKIAELKDKISEKDLTITDMNLQTLGMKEKYYSLEKETEQLRFQLQELINSK